MEKCNECGKEMSYLGDYTYICYGCAALSDEEREKRRQLQHRLIYSAIVAGKSATFTDAVMERLFPLPGVKAPFVLIKNWVEEGTLNIKLRLAGTGNYLKMMKCLPALTKLNPETCTLEELEEVHGVGPKTARFFLLWTRPGVRLAALDTHILAWLREQGIDAPKATPPAGERYKHLERIFISYADDLNMTPRELDYKIWSEKSGYEGAVQSDICHCGNKREFVILKGSTTSILACRVCAGKAYDARVEVFGQEATASMCEILQWVDVKK